MKRYLAIFLSVLMVCATAVGCSSDSDPVSAGSDAKSVTEKPIEDTPKKTESVKTESKVEEKTEDQPPSESQANVPDEYSSYEAIYEEYSQKLKDVTDEYFTEAAANKDRYDLVALIFIEKETNLYELTIEGVEKMEAFMQTHDSGNTDKCEEWSQKLFDVFDEEEAKISDDISALTEEVQGTE